MIPDDDSFARVKACRMNLLESSSDVNSPSPSIFEYRSNQYDQRNEQQKNNNKIEILIRQLHP